MINFLVHTFITDYENITHRTVRSAYGKLCGVVGIVCNFLLFLGKMVAGILSGSLSIVADAINNLSDASSSIISLLGFKLAEKPADMEHPYGHGRYEYLAGLFVSILILIIGATFLKEGVQKIFHPQKAEFSVLSIAILAVSIWIKLWMMHFNKKIGQKIFSQALLAASQDSRNDVFSSAAVLLTALLAHFFSWNLDGWVSVGISLFVLYSGIEMIREILNPLLGMPPDPKQVKEIEKKIKSYPGVLGIHDLILHDYGPGRQFASVHIEMAAERDVILSHDTIDDIEKDFWEQDQLHLVIHYDPIVTTEKRIVELRAFLEETVKEIDPNLSVHDLRIVEGISHTNLVFDCVVPFKFRLSGLELKQEIISKVTSVYPKYRLVITLDTFYANTN